MSGETVGYQSNDKVSTRQDLFKAALISSKGANASSNKILVVRSGTKVLEEPKRLFAINKSAKVLQNAASFESFKPFSISTRANTLESDELEQAKSKPEFFMSERLNFQIRPTPKRLKLDLSNRELSSRPIVLPEIRTPSKVLCQNESDSSRIDLPSIKIKRKFEESINKAKQSLKNISEVVDPTKLQGLAKSYHSYYNHGLYLHRKGTDRERTQKYYDHITKSFQVLKEIKSDRCVEEPDTIGQFGFQRRKRLVLALDLDETLIHCCNFDPPEMQNYQSIVNYKSDKGAYITAKINVRPFVTEFLKDVSKYYDVVIYTASEREYAMAVVDFIDPTRKYIREIFHRENCFRTKKGFVVKDLRVILPDDLDRVILVDNSSQCFAPQINNGIPIISYTYDEADEELLHLRDFLLHLKDQPFVIKCLEQTFRLSQYTKFTHQDHLLTFLTALQNA